ncbi:MAG TPA: hypothetical protein VOA80_18725 [Thermoanaerobaculia bacterium]|nr:hypothetical protein [Thermoanaerobaculia bacterium]
MTPARSPVQWALPALAVVAYLVAALVWVGNDRRAARAVFPAGSVWNTGDDGLSLAFAYLSARAAGQPAGARVAVLTRRLESTPLPPRAVLLRVEPEAGRLAAMARRLEDGNGDEDDDGDETGGQGGAGRGGKTAGKGKDASGGKAAGSGNGGGSGKGAGSGGSGNGAGSGASAAKRGAGPHPWPAPAPVPAPVPTPVPEPEAAARTVALLTAAEEAWVRDGGRLVLAVASGSGAALEVEVGHAGTAGLARKSFPIWPGVRRLLPDPPRTLGGPALTGMHALWLEGDAPIVARLVLGAGDLVLLACPEVLHNRLLGRGDHLALLEALAGAGAGGEGGKGGDRGRPVFFDERGHGAEESAGMLEILASWGLGPLLLLLAAAGGAAWWRAAVRVGPPDRDDRDVRSDAVELVDSLADLYDRALGRGDALRLYYDNFVRTVAADTGLQGAALAARTADLAPGLSLAELPPSRETLEPLEPLAAAAPTRPAAARPAAVSPAVAASILAASQPATDLPRPAFDRLLDTLNQAFRRLDDAKRR